MEGCYFKLLNKCTKTADDDLSSAGADRIKSIIKACHDRGDELPTDLEAAIIADEQYKILCHRDCVSTYCSKYKIRKFTESTKRSSTVHPPRKRTRRSASASDFCFQTQCIFCGKECIETKDPKNPSRWHSVSCIRTVQQGEKSMKEAILTACNERNDTWAQEVELRVHGAFSDLHAADGRYHNDCKPAFMAPKSVDRAHTSKKPEDKNVAFNKIIEIMESDADRMWSSVELHKLYQENNGVKLQRRALIEELSTYFGDSILVLSCKGLASMLVFRSRASQLVHLFEETDVDYANVKSIAKQIVHESKALEQDTSSYSSRIDESIAHSQCS
jgi:hypothetical protein